MRTIAAEKNIRTMLTVCCSSIAIGTFALALVAAIMSGVEKTTHTKLQGIHADVSMQSYNKAPLAFEKITAALVTKFPQIISAAPIMEQHIIVQGPHSNDISNVVLLQGIDPVVDAQTRTLATAVKSSITLSCAIAHKNILIGSALAHNLDVEVGETITLLYTDEQTTNKITFEQVEATIGGIFETGIESFDATTIFCSLTTFKELFPEKGIIQINLKLQPSYDSKKYIQKLKNYFNLDVFSWQELYQPLMTALILEKYAMILILILVTLIASMNTVSLLFMYITQKRATIAVLMAMGMQKSTVRAIFMIIGMTIAMGSGIVGLIGACIASWLLETYHLITLPDIYYTTYLPADMNWNIICGVLSIVGVVSFGATIVATGSIKQISIARILKFEG
jgi:lipoprotein-releasing system permease protein